MSYLNTTSFDYNYDNSCVFQNQQHKIFDDVLNMMMIDDSKKDIELFEELLGIETNLKFHISKWTNGQEAINALKSRYVTNPHLIVLDLNMPSINGIRTLYNLQEVAKSRSIPIVIHSSEKNFDKQKEVQKLNASAFFTKPVDTQMFEAFVLGKEI